MRPWESGSRRRGEYGPVPNSGPVVRSQTGMAGYYKYEITMLYGVRI